MAMRAMTLDGQVYYQKSTVYYMPVPVLYAEMGWRFEWRLLG